jgi:citrate synthase
MKGLETALLLLAEHGANNSTFVARVVASTAASPSACFVAAVASFGGPLHGRAVELSFRELERLASANDRCTALADYVSAVRTGRLRPMGFGHALYKSRDPRAPWFERIARSLATPQVESLLAIARAMEEGLQFLAKRGIHANGDLFAGICYRALGFEPSFFTVLHALGRAVGWLAHIREQRTRGTLIRPLFKYCGRARSGTPSGAV